MRDLTLSQHHFSATIVCFPDIRLFFYLHSSFPHLLNTMSPNQINANKTLMKTERKKKWGKKTTEHFVSPEQCFNIILTISAMLRELLEQSENEKQNITKKREKNSVVCSTMRTTRLEMTFLTVNQLTVECGCVHKKICFFFSFFSIVFFAQFSLCERRNETMCTMRIVHNVWLLMVGLIWAKCLIIL